MDEIEFLYSHLKDYFYKRFDFKTLTDPYSSPFVQITYISYLIKEAPNIGSCSFFITNPEKSVYYSQSIAKSLSTTNTLTSQYLSQPPDNMQQIANSEGGYVGGIVINETDILIIAVLADPEDAQFIFQTISQEIAILTSP